MVISDRAWHLRLVRKVYDKKYQPTNLCSYVSMVVFASIVMVFGCAFVVAPFVLLAWMAWVFIQAGEFWIFLMICALATTISGIWYALLWLIRWEIARLTKQPKQPSLLKEWISAKKGKYCPMITVRND